MTAFYVARVDVTDPETYAEYARLAPGTVIAHGGKYRVRGGRTKSLEGRENSVRNVIIEFPTFEQADTWYYSPEYQAIIPIRQKASESEMFIVEGYW
ncbi:MAG: DUF1330 domain-containing protein [Alphaproteobacteria bacterium]|nr:DUF1330 domain-containing protein [Alphaproteobacteria bacterium]MCY4498522.1 DUF1330 domain-containing protein [Rhodospirillaceae bacterium]